MSYTHTLDGAQMSDVAACYAAIASSFGTPALASPDAVKSVVGKVPGPISLLWKNADAAQKAFGADFEAIADALIDLTATRADFTVTIM